MLINPSPTTLLAMWLSGGAAGGAGSGGQRRAGQGTHCPRRTCPAQVLQRRQTTWPPRPRPTATAGWASAGVTATAGHIRLVVEQQRERALHGHRRAEAASPRSWLSSTMCRRGHRGLCCRVCPPLPHRLCLPSPCASCPPNVPVTMETSPH